MGLVWSSWLLESHEAGMVQVHATTTYNQDPKPCGFVQVVGDDVKYLSIMFSTPYRGLYRGRYSGVI